MADRPDRRRVVVVLDDDPTGAQASADLAVLVDAEADPTRLLATEDALHVLTNTRALPEEQAVELVRRVRRRVEDAAVALGIDVEFVLRGDSTLRGHVFAESDVLGAADDVLLFVPAYPAASRTTLGGVHYVEIDGVRRVAADTEFAADPVFGYSARTMREWVHEVGGHRPVRCVPLDALRADPDGTALADELQRAPAGSVVIPDIATLGDIVQVVRGMQHATRRGRRVVARGAAPFAALLTGRLATSYHRPARTADTLLVVCGSHTAASTAQLRELAIELDTPVHTADTRAALEAGGQEAGRLAEQAADDLRRNGVAIIASERDRRAEHRDLAHGAAVMHTLCAAVGRLTRRQHPTTAPAAAPDPSVAPDPAALPDTAVVPDTVVVKGGITAADVARTGLGVTTARVRGPLATGVAWWQLELDTGTVDYLVVPGNVGGPRTLVDVTEPWRTRTVTHHGR